MNVILASVYHRSFHYGGNEQYLHHLALGLVQSGIKVTYICGRGNQQKLPYHLKTLPIIHLAGKPLPTPSWWTYLNQHHPDLVHCSGSGFPLLALAASAKKLGIPTILTYQADSHPNTLFKFFTPLERLSIAHCYRNIISTTEHYQKLLSHRYPQLYITNIPLMITPRPKTLNNRTTARRLLNLPHNKKIILFVGQLSSHHYYKGIDDLFIASSQLPKNYMLLMVGAGDKLAHYQKQAQDLNLPIRFAGFVPDTQITNYFKAADLLVLPSNSASEGFGLTLIEAMAQKLPTITTHAVGSASLLKQFNVSPLVPPNSPYHLAKAIIHLGNHPDKTIISKAYDFSKIFTLENMVAKTIKLYQSLI